VTTAKFSEDLYRRVTSVARPGTVIRTLSNGAENRIVNVSRTGIEVQTTRSKRQGTNPVVPAWMIERAWERLRSARRLTNQELLNDLGLRRSSFVSALLAKFPEVEVESTRPIVLLLR
jgi:hypothetical protein